MKESVSSVNDSRAPIGNRIAVRREIRVFAIFAALIMAVTVFAAPAEMAAAEYYDGFSFDPELSNSTGTSTGDSNPSITNPATTPGSNEVAGPPGSVVSRFQSELSSVESMGDYAPIVQFTQYSDRCEYQTEFGLYAFYYSAPASFRLSDLEGKEIVESASFAIGSPNSSITMGDSFIIETNDHLYQAKQAVFFDGVGAGYLLTTASFVRGEIPKFSAEMTFLTDHKNPDFMILWQVDSPASGIRMDGSVYSSDPVGVTKVAKNYSFELLSDVKNNQS